MIKDNISSINRHLMTSNDSSYIKHNSKKKHDLTDKVVINRSDERFSSANEQPLPLVISKLRDEVDVKCSKRINKMNANEDDCALPLDLCVKKPKDEIKDTSSEIRKTSIFAKSSVDINHTFNNKSHNIAGISAINTPQYNPLYHSSRKRGRKPKSILATTSASSNTVSNVTVPSNLNALTNFSDNKPRKRGRPPTLSPPLPGVQSKQPLAAHISHVTKALSSSSAFQHHLPYMMLNALQPGFSHQLQALANNAFFSDKLNGNEMLKFHKNSANVSESSDNMDSMASESESNDESGTDSGSQVNRLHTSGYNNMFGVNENELRIPFQFGWRRETRITNITNSGVEGEVVYYSPCDHKLRTYSDIVKYLTKKRITNVSKRYFDFNPQVVLGNYKIRSNSGNDMIISEKDFCKQLEELRRMPGNRVDNKRKSSNDSISGESISNKETHGKNHGLMDRTRAQMPRDAKRAKLEALKINIKEQQQLELMRLEKINKSQQIEEARRKKREELEKQKQEEILKKEKELKRQQLELIREQEIQRRRELLIMADLERERRRQHMMLVRALDTHKKNEERERKKEEIIAERLRLQEKKMQKRKLEMELMRELKKPVDDMMLKDLQPLPTLNRIPGLKLPGKVFADTLMVYEFLHNFGETLGFDMDSLPTLNTLTQALLNIDEGSEEELLSVIHHLLVCAIEDPGLPTNMTTIMGQKLKDAPITNYNITEILRLYFQAFNLNIRDDIKEERIESQMVNILGKSVTFLALNAIKKAEILAFLCNELLCNQAIVKQIDENIETVSNIRRDKWIHENELRKWKTIKAKREKKSQQQMDENKKNDLETVEEDRDSADSDAEETQNGSINTTNNDSEDEPGLTNEEIDKKIDKLTKQFNQMNNKLNKAINMYRVSPLGQDRYRRRYWVLPNAGGVFVEGIESGEPEELANNVWTEEELNKCNEVKDEINETKCENSKTDSELQKDLNNENNEENSIEEKEEKEENDMNENEDIKELDEDETNGTEKVNDIKSEDIKKESDQQINEITHNFNGVLSKDVKSETNTDTDVKFDTSVTNDVIKSDLKSNTKTDTNLEKVIDDNVSSDITSALQNDSQWLSPFVTQVLAGSLLLNNGTSQLNNGVSSTTSFGLNSNNSSNSKSTQPEKTWFSVLPRMPCDDSVSPDEMDLSLCETNKTPKTLIKLNDSNNSSQKIQQLPLSSLINGLPSNLFMQAFLYPHILSSLFNQQNGGNGPCPPDASPLSFRASSVTKDLNNTTSTMSLNNESNCETQETIKPMFETINGDLLFDNEIDICPALKNRIIQQREQQYERPQKISNEYQFGWWRITDASQLRNMIEVLHNRGIRERHLQKHLIKYLTYASQSCKSNVAELEITDLDRKIAENCLFGAPRDGKCPHEECASSDWCQEVALRFDITVLEQIEALEEKITTSSMQIRNWKPLPRISNDEDMNFKAAANFVGLIKRKIESEDNDDNDCVKLNDDNNESPLSSKELCPEIDGVNPVFVARDRLLALEAVIERRYLKPPLGFKSNTILISTNNSDAGASDEYSENAADENATSGLLRWREAVRESECSSQIALCLHFLEGCIAWDKSIMRASCQFCGSGENEAQLLLCDGCDKGYHMYCFKPKMESIPDGDWFCFECQNKNTIDKVCIVCGKKGKLLNCDSCAKVFHPNCLDPPINKPLKGKWICHMCGRKPKKPNSQKSSKKSHNYSSEEKLIESINIASTPINNTPEKSSVKEVSKRMSNGTNKTEKEPKKDKKSKQSDKSCELNFCKKILEAMEDNEHSWPFLLPVNTKQFPTYKKIIKKPMDTTTIKSKLDASSYKNKEEFSLDVRQIFDNCVTFNEDESPVGQAGHNLRAFFQIKWKEYFGS
ncbi:bromodomain adjacent to zinc finger domain protein 2B-like [Oppia nitens]|uniref:bromodomain adjacent to zinc finger domain protein 2B-like n=1 Tax=Oppia nitens TaxID=1686743 RepID=UPI0023DBF9A5|nr:bromodomain adjacent to zinc finger domain protein 2B-like [Oppia nitens]